LLVLISHKVSSCNHRDETGVDRSLLVQLAWGNSPPLVMLRPRKREREREKDRTIDWKMGYGGGLEREESSLDERKWSL